MCQDGGREEEKKGGREREEGRERERENVSLLWSGLTINSYHHLEKKDKAIS